LHKAGFERVVATVTADADGDAESTLRTATYWAQYLRSPEMRAEVIRARLTNEAALEQMADAWLRWGQSTGAFWARFWCQAVGWVPAG
jgi:hypothetical protein